MRTILMILALVSMFAAACDDGSVTEGGGTTVNGKPVTTNTNYGANPCDNPFKRPDCFSPAPGQFGSQNVCAWNVVNNTCYKTSFCESVTALQARFGNTCTLTPNGQITIPPNSILLWNNGENSIKLPVIEHAYYEGSNGYLCLPNSTELTLSCSFLHNIVICETSQLQSPDCILNY